LILILLAVTAIIVINIMTILATFNAPKIIDQYVQWIDYQRKNPITDPELYTDALSIDDLLFIVRGWSKSIRNMQWTVAGAGALNLVFIFGIFNESNTVMLNSFAAAINAGIVLLFINIIRQVMLTERLVDSVTSVYVADEMYKLLAEFRSENSEEENDA
jgi:hypothetical protein